MILRRWLFTVLVILLAISLQSILVAGASSRLVLQKTWGGPSREVGWAIAVGSDGSLYVAGETNSFGLGNTDVFLLKFSSDGRLVWQRTWGGASFEQAYAVTVGLDGNVYVTGITSSFGPPFNPAFLLKFSPSGDLLWQRIWGEGGAEYGLGIASGSDGAIYIAGQTNGGLRYDSSDMFIVKFSQDGNLLWQRVWFSPSDLPRDWERASSVAVAGDGTVYVAGDGVSFSPMREIILLKFSPDGNLVWQRLYSRGTADFSKGVAVAPDGTVYVAGSGILLLKISSDGALLWDRRYGGGFGASIAYAVAVAGDGRVFVAGWTDSFGAGLRDVLVLSFSPSGSLSSQRTWGASASSEEARAAAVSDTGTVYVTGYATGPPRYRFLRAEGDVAVAGGFLRTPEGALETAAGFLAVPNGSVTSPGGSTKFAGDSDTILLGING